MAEDERSDNAAREDGHADNARGLAGPRIRAAAHIHRSEAGYRLGSDRGSPNHGSTLFSKRVMAEIRSPVRVRT